MDVTLLIPAYKPTSALIDIVKQAQHQFHSIIIVNDGSGDAYASVFKQLPIGHNIVTINHPVNQGKGAALRSGLNHWQNHFKHESMGVVTADADGQHAMEDIIKIATELEKKTDQLHLGVRSFADKIPLRSKLGNNCTLVVFKLLTGQALQDTQTGLRGIPGQIIPILVSIKPSGYEYETIMLIKCIQHKVVIRQHTIQTIYIDHNSSSHFRPIRDSYKVYQALLWYSLMRLLT